LWVVIQLEAIEMLNKHYCLSNFLIKLHFNCIINIGI
jgi:hypothetical protein